MHNHADSIEDQSNEEHSYDNQRNVSSHHSHVATVLVLVAVSVKSQ